MIENYFYKCFKHILGYYPYLIEKKNGHDQRMINTGN